MKRLLRLVLAITALGLLTAARQGVEVPLADSPALGPENAPVTMIEFIDFQ